MSDATCSTSAITTRSSDASHKTQVAGDGEEEEENDGEGIIRQVLEELVDDCTAGDDTTRTTSSIDASSFVIDTTNAYREHVQSHSEDEDDGDSEGIPDSSSLIDTVVIASDSDSDVEFNRILALAHSPHVAAAERVPHAAADAGHGRRRPAPPFQEPIVDLPPIEKLSIHADRDVQLVKLGSIQHLVREIAVVQSDYGVPPLDCDTILFDASRNAVGVVFEVFGPVTRPLYTMRFDSADDLQESALCPGVDVFFAPTKAEWTRAVFTDALLKMRGTDGRTSDDPIASGEEDEEEFFSDDEAEQRAKAARRGRKPYGEPPSSSLSSSEHINHPPTRGGRGRGRRGRGGDAQRGRGGRGRPGHPEFHPSPSGFYPSVPHLPVSPHPRCLPPPPTFAHPPPGYPLQHQFGQVSWRAPPVMNASRGVARPGASPVWNHGAAQSGLATWTPPAFVPRTMPRAQFPHASPTPSIAAVRRPPKKTPRMEESGGDPSIEFVDRRYMNG